MQSKKFPKKCRHCGSLKFDRDAVGSLEWMNFRCGSSCDQRGEWSQSDECRITELEAIEAAKDREIEQLRAENARLKKLEAAVSDEELILRLVKDCPSRQHDERYCDFCEGRESGMDQYQMKLIAILEEPRNER